MLWKGSYVFDAFAIYICFRRYGLLVIIRLLLRIIYFNLAGSVLVFISAILNHGLRLLEAARFKLLEAARLKVLEVACFNLWVDL